MGVSDVARDRETEAHARRFGALREAFEQRVGELGRDATTRVGDVDARGVGGGLARRSQSYLAAGWRMSQRIREQVDEHLADADRVNVSGKSRVGVQYDSARLGLWPEVARRLGNELGEINRLQLQPKAAGLGEGSRAKVFDHAIERLRLVENALELLVVAPTSRTS